MKAVLSVVLSVCWMIGSSQIRSRNADTAASKIASDTATTATTDSLQLFAKGTNNTTIAGGNDTTFNVNTIAENGALSTLGAVDRSGQAQFGQSNWGTNRSTIGEGQWTVPPPITASFNREFPAANAATWTRNNIDTSSFSVKHRSGAQWVTTSYNNRGQRLDRRTEYPVLQPPRGVVVYATRQPNNFKIVKIYKLQIQGKPDVYEIEAAGGKKIYLNNEGMEVNY